MKHINNYELGITNGEALMNTFKKELIIVNN